MGTTNSSLNMAGSSVASDNFYSDFQSFVAGYDAPARLLHVLDGMPPVEANTTEPTIPPSSTPAPTDASVTATSEVPTEPVYGKHYHHGPCIIAAPNRASPSTYYLRGFKIDGPTMRAFLKAVEANPVKTVTVHIARCNLTEEGYNCLVSDANFSQIKRLVLVGPISEAPTTLDFTKLFSCTIETLKLHNWGLDDAFLERSVAALQKNESLALLSLDFNNFGSQARSCLDKILRINRKLVFISMRSGCTNATSQTPPTEYSFAKTELTMNPSGLEQLRSIKLKGSDDICTVPQIFKSESIERRGGKVYFMGNSVFKKMVF